MTKMLKEIPNATSSSLIFTTTASQKVAENIVNSITAYPTV